MKKEINDDKKFNRIIEISKIVVSVATLFVIGYYANYLANLTKSKETDQKYVELSISILKNKPKESETFAIRKWALKVLDSCSPIKLDDSTKKELLEKPIFLNQYKTCPDGINVYEYSINECPKCDSLKNK